MRSLPLPHCWQIAYLVGRGKETLASCLRTLDTKKCLLISFASPEQWHQRWSGPSRVCRMPELLRAGFSKCGRLRTHMGHTWSRYYRGRCQVPLQTCWIRSSEGGWNSEHCSKCPGDCPTCTNAGQQWAGAHSCLSVGAERRPCWHLAFYSCPLPPPFLIALWSSEQ